MDYRVLDRGTGKLLSKELGWTSSLSESALVCHTLANIANRNGTYAGGLNTSSIGQGRKSVFIYEFSTAGEREFASWAFSDRYEDNSTAAEYLQSKFKMVEIDKLLNGESVTVYSGRVAKYYEFTD